jgi:hypothetical protein
MELLGRELRLVLGQSFGKGRPQSQRRTDGLVAGGVGRRSDPASLPVPQTTLLLTLADDHTKTAE